MQFFDKNADRHIERWRRPGSFAPGWTRAFYITIPRTELRRSGSDDSSLRWAEDPGPGYWVNLEVALVDPGIDTTLSLDDGLYLGTLSLRNGGHIIVFARRYKPEVQSARMVAQYRNKFVANSEI